MPIVLSYQLLADGVLVMHFAVVAFVVGGLVLIVVGNRRAWGWANRLWFRLVHLACIAVVVAESWLNITCPLTVLESWLRFKAGSAPYDQSFIEHWVQALLYYDAPPWAFAVAYTAFGLLVLAVWWYFPPTIKSQGEKGGAKPVGPAV